MYKLNYFRILILTFLISRAYSAIKFNNLQEKLVFKLLKVQPRVNLVASALLLRFPLCKLASVATGDAKEELMTVLGYSEDAMLESCYSKLREPLKIMGQGDLTAINRMYVNYTDQIDPMFFANTTEKFGIQVEKVGFNYPKAAISYINRAFAATTYRRVVEILEPNDININTMMVIVAGAYYKGTFEFPFDFRMTKLQQFRHIDGKVSKVPMMTRTDSYSYVTDTFCQAISIKFMSWRSDIYIFLPHKPEDLPKLLNKFEAEPNYVINLIKQMKSTLIKVLLPRFRIKSFVDWTGFLQELGLYSIFNKNSSDLSGIYKKDSPIKNIVLDKVKQKLSVQIDEMGVNRYIRDPLRDKLGMPERQIFSHLLEFNADRPFYFQISLDFESARYELFSGVYYGPDPDVVNP